MDYYKIFYIKHNHRAEAYSRFKITRRTSEYTTRENHKLLSKSRKEEGKKITTKQPESDYKMALVKFLNIYNYCKNKWIELSK